MKVVVTPSFIKSDNGQIFSINYHSPELTNNIGIIHFPAFAEEMNKSRHMAALQARKFAADGYSVTIVDLFGTGDSEGDFSNASWCIWLDNLTQIVEIMKANGVEKLIFWGTRLGSMLAMDLLNSYRKDVSLILLWQPVLKGDVALTQFLRLKIAAEMMSGEKSSTNGLKNKLNQNELIEVAGYQLNSDIANAMQNQHLFDKISANTPPIRILEIVSDVNKSISIASRKFIEKLHEKKIDILIDKVVGEQFWTTPEISLVDELLDKSSIIVNQFSKMR